MEKYCKIKTFRITEEQNNTLKKMKSFNVDVGRFIRDAVREKIEKEYSYLIIKKRMYKDKFLYDLDEAIDKLKSNS